MCLRLTFEVQPKSFYKYQCYTNRLEVSQFKYVGYINDFKIIQQVDNSCISFIYMYSTNLINRTCTFFQQSTPSEQVTPGGQSNKSVKLDSGSGTKKLTPQKSEKSREMVRSSSQPLITDPAQTNTPQVITLLTLDSAFTSTTINFNIFSGLKIRQSNFVPVITINR